MDDTLIKVEDLCKIYNPGENEVWALDHVSLEIKKGELVAIIGQSGSGKSTFMNMLGCLDVPTSGKYYLNGTDVSEMSDNELSEVRNREIGFIFQGFNLIANLNAIENVELPLIYRGIDRKTRHQLAIDSLKMVGLEKRMDHKPSEMSGGQQQWRSQGQLPLSHRSFSRMNRLEIWILPQAGKYSESSKRCIRPEERSY